MGAVLVEDADDAVAVLRALDAPGRVIYVDVERKQPPNLMAIALENVHSAEIRAAKPNDSTVRAFAQLLRHECGESLAGLRVGVFGLGNLGFKIALLLAEVDCEVFAHHRRPAVGAKAVEVLNEILPTYVHCPVKTWGSDGVSLLVASTSAQKCVTKEWLDLVDDGGLVIDVGIDNLDEAALAAAHARGIRVLRLDTRADGEPVPSASPGFFEEVFGVGTCVGVDIVSGGILAARGAVVVDSYANPRQVVGVANGHGGLVRSDDLTDEEREQVNRVRAAVQRP